MEPTYPQKNSPLSIPIAIVIAGALIAGAVFFSRGGAPVVAKLPDTKEVSPSPYQNTAIAIRSLDAADHIRGNPDAPVLLFEYSDPECPFCKNFHLTLKQLIDEYGKSGKLAWVYREFPLAQLHPKAPKEAEALECAGDLGGNGKFWDYTDLIFQITTSNNGLDPQELPMIAQRVGLDVNKFNDCLSTGKNTARIQKDYAEATGAGGNGTPFSIILVKEPISQKVETELLSINQDLLRQMPQGSPDPLIISADKTKISIGGAFSYQLMKRIVELLVK